MLPLDGLAARLSPMAEFGFRIVDADTMSDLTKNELRSARRANTARLPNL